MKFALELAYFQLELWMYASYNELSVEAFFSTEDCVNQGVYYSTWSFSFKGRAYVPKSIAL